MSNLQNGKTNRQLRQLLDSNDSFLSKGHQILKVRERKVRIPDWATNDVLIRVLLIRAFPKLETDLLQRKRAGRWMRVIQLFYRSGMSYGRVAEEMGEKATVIKRLMQGIRRTAAGQSVRKSGKMRKRVDDRMSLGKL